MKGRRAPNGGYLFGNKAQYRRDVWGAFKKGSIRSDHRKPGATTVALLPSKEMREIEVARRNGFRTSNMHAIDSNPAIAAQFTRRFPNIKGYGVTVGRAFDRMADNGIRVEAANLDFCACVGPTIEHELLKVCDSGALADHAMVALTVLRGRELRETTDELVEYERWIDSTDPMIRAAAVSVGLGTDNGIDAVRVNDKGFSRRDIARTIWIQRRFAASGFGTVMNRTGIYSSGRSTMLWAIFRVVRSSNLEWLYERDVAFVRRRFYANVGNEPKRTDFRQAVKCNDIAAALRRIENYDGCMVNYCKYAPDGADLVNELWDVVMRSRIPTVRREPQVTGSYTLASSSGGVFH